MYAGILYLTQIGELIQGVLGCYRKFTAICVAPKRPSCPGLGDLPVIRRPLVVLRSGHPFGWAVTPYGSEKPRWFRKFGPRDWNRGCGKVGMGVILRGIGRGVGLAGRERDGAAREDLARNSGFSDELRYVFDRF